MESAPSRVTFFKGPFLVKKKKKFLASLKKGAGPTVPRHSDFLGPRGSRSGQASSLVPKLKRRRIPILFSSWWGSNVLIGAKCRKIWIVVRQQFEPKCRKCPTNKYPKKWSFKSFSEQQKILSQNLGQNFGLFSTYDFANRALLKHSGGDAGLGLENLD